MIQFQEYLSSDYPGFASFIDTIIKPIFGDGFRPDADLQEMIEYPDEIEEFDLISNSHDEDFRQLAQDCNVTRLLKLGIIRTSNGIPIHVYDITVGSRKHLARNRKGIQEIIRRNSEMTNQTGAFMLFHYADTTWEWRFSYCYVGRNREDTTSAKRYTYLLGRGQSCKTAALRFQTLLKKKGKIAMDDITEAFSVESVSKEFFDQYRLNYADIVCYVTGKRMVKSGGKWEEKQEHEPNEFIMQQFAQFADPEKAVRDYVKKLMGRLVFLQFIQKKGWLGVPMDDASWTKGDKEFIQHLFAQYENKDNFIDDVLEPLFNDINTRRADDKANPVLGNDIKVPYLNGGLFEKDAEDDTTFPLPAKYMQVMLDFFSAYNFTIDENDPDDAEVGVDPEMLGRVFENLLEDNKDKGAFYTPKEIVQYMCRESLIAYLQTDIEDDAAKLSFRDFVTTHEVSTLKPADVYKVDKKLREVKICDPAIGSGAFPMGLLKELFDCRMAIEGEEEGKTPAEIKKDIIQNSIYGVDIEKGAVDIARLRFWLSLIIDEQTPHALPNMDFKIMQGNSLLEQYKGVRLDNIYSNSGQMELAFDEETAARMLFLEHIYKYFKEDDHDKKKELLVLIDNAVKSLVKAKTLGNEEIAESIDSLDLRNNTDFFLWHTWFNDVFENGGFDIVIGNPPYLRLQGMKDSSTEQADLYAQVYKSATGSFDLYVCFAELALSIINKKGLANFIMPVKWSNASFGKGFRSVISLNKAAYKIVNFGAYQVFNASTYTALQWFKPGTKKLKYCELDRDLSTNSELGNYLDSLQEDNMAEISNSKLGKEPWVLTVGGINTLLAKLEKQPRRVSDVFDKIFQGLATGKDDVFFIKDCTIQTDVIKGFSKMINEEVLLEKDLCHPLLKGEDVHRYSDVETNRYVVLPYNREDNEIKLLSEEYLSIQYPLAYAYFKNCEDVLRKREKGRFDIEGAWFQLSRKQGLAAAETEKLIAPDISMGGNFAYDFEGKFYQTATLYGYVKKENIRTSYEVLMAILNSKLCWWFIQNTGAVMSGGFYRYKPAYINPFPFPSEEKIEKYHNNLLVLSESILSAKKSNPKADTSAEEQEIDQLVYKLYNLTPEEIAIVENKNE